MQNPQLLQLTMGLCLLTVSWLLFSIWREAFVAVEDEKRMDFLIFNVKGSGWLFAVFALCGGVFCLLQPVFG